MAELLHDLLPEATAQTLELMAFVAALPLDAPPALPPGAVIVSLRFRGYLQGCVELGTSEAFGQMLADNILGPGEDESQGRLRSQDALKEALNVLCGTLLRQLCAAGKVVEMSLPEIKPATAEAWAALTADEQSLLLDADGHVLVVRANYKETA